MLVCPETLLPVRLDSKEPIAPQQLQSPEPSKREKAVYAQRKLEYDSALTRFRTAQELQQKFGPGFETAVDGYNASHNIEQDNDEMNGREKNSGFETIRINRGRAEPVIAEMMGPRLIASPDVFFASTEHTRNATIHYTHFNEKLVPNGYDMPPNDKLNAYDAATINFAMLGAQSHIQNFFQKELGGYGSTSAALESTNGHNMMTGLFGNPCRDLDLERCLGEAMRLGKESIDALFLSALPSPKRISTQPAL